MKNFKIYSTILALLFIIQTNAQLQVDAQLRLRGQAFHGYKKPVAEKTDAAFHVGQRTRLNLQYHTQKFTTRFSFQDVRVWGDANIVNPTGVKGKSYNTFDVYEAWVKIPLSSKSFLKLGRQEMKYDDQRHISWRNWWDRGQTYDAALYSYKNKQTGWQVDISGSYNSKKQDLIGNDYSDGTDYFGTVNPMITQEFLYIKKKMNKMYVSFTGIISGYQKEGTKNVIYMTNTAGLHLNYNATKKATDGLLFKGNAFLQSGKNIKGQTISAYMLTAQACYRTMQKKLELSAKVEMLSGQDANNTNADYIKTDHTYNLLTGGRHPYYEGYIDWFVIPKSNLYGGFMNVGFNLTYKASKKDILKLDFNSVSNTTATKKMTSEDLVKFDKGLLTNNIDLTYVRVFAKNIKLMTGFSYAMPSDMFNKMKGITKPGKNYFFYTMLTITPTLYKQKVK